MKNLRWQILVVVLALLAIGVILFSQQPSFSAIQPEMKPTTGGIYTEGLVGRLGRLNPILDYYNPADQDVNRLLYSSLVRFDSRGLPYYDLVESMGISKDGLIYNFSLRPDVHWHDGKPVTSADVLFTIELMRNEEFPVPADIRKLWQAVEVKALNELMIQFRLPEPLAPFLDYLTFGILPQHLLEGLSPDELVQSQFNINPVGSGPYQFERLLVEDKQIVGLVLRTYKEYYRKPPYIEQFIIRYYPDAQSALAAYQAGEVMGISQISLDVLPAALKEPHLNLYTSQLPELVMVFLNLNNPEVSFFQDMNIRRALLLGLNRQRLIDEMLGSQAIIANGPIFPGSWAYYDGLERISYDPDKAISMLKEAGYTIPAEGGVVRVKDGQRLSFTLVHPHDEKFTALATAIQRDWERLGVEVKLLAVAYEQLLGEYLEPRSYQAVLAEIDLTRSPDPDLYPFWHQTQVTGGQNYSRWDDRQASEFLEQARLITDLAERARLYRNFQVRFAGELPALLLYYPVYTYGVDSLVQGVSTGLLYDTSDRYSTVTEWFLLAARAATLPPTPAQTSPTVAP